MLASLPRPLVLLMLASAALFAAEPPLRTIDIQLPDATLTGKPLAWSRQQVILLGRDGALHEIHVPDIESFDGPRAGFRSLSIAEMRGQLQREFGRRFDVTGTGHFLVVHPAGRRDRWAQRFEDLYRDLRHYFVARGWVWREPEFPLVAIAFPTRSEFLSYARSQGAPIGSGVLGYYSNRSNRILLYDVTAENLAADGRLNAEVIIHEATHQIAFNTGLHNRLPGPPLWVAEGLAMLFEAPGVHDAGSHQQLAARINADRLAYFRQAYREPEPIAEPLVLSDASFKVHPLKAYAGAWVLSFYLSERQPRAYVRYLAATASFATQAPTAAERRRVFQEHFGSDFSMLDARIRRFVRSLP